MSLVVDHKMLIPISVNLLETLLCNCLLWQLWRCALRSFFRRPRLPVCSAASLELQHLWDPLSFPTMAMLFRSWTLLPSQDPAGSSLCAGAPCGLADFLSLFTFPSFTRGLSLSLEALYAFSCPHTPGSFLGIVLNTL